MKRLISPPKIRVGFWLFVFSFALLWRLTIQPSLAHTHPSSSGNMLLASNREELAICVDVLFGAEGVPPQGLANQIRDLLDNPIKAHPRWSELGYDQFQTRVEIGCPTEAYLIQPGAAHPLLPWGIEATTWVSNVETPSPYRVHVYVVSPTVIKNSFRGTDLRYAPQEYICENGDCFEVTGAVYLSPSEALNPQFVQNRLERILALDLADVEGY